MGKIVFKIAILAFFVSQPILAFANSMPNAKQLEEHLLWRIKITTNPGSLSAPLDGDQAANLLDELKYDSLADMDSAKLTSAKLTVHPWSDSYWPIYLGELANRYADPHYPASNNWDENKNYILEHMGKDGMQNYSAAEKYDLLLGDENFSLTKAMVNDGEQSKGADGKVETWMGICHGWSPASFMLDRPRKMVSVKSVNNTELLFYPSDIKGLASLLWANANVSTRFIGGRCEEKNPRRDHYGRPINIDCLDNNPATWHLAVVNQIGYAKRSFVIDATYDYEVWNQPVLGYEYSYFDIRSKKPVSNLPAALIDVEKYPNDKFKKLRAPGTKFLVGVSMKLTYVSETQPNTHSEDSDTNDANTTVNYQYDLELNAAGKIIGGEWYSEGHPDFLWQPVSGSEARSAGDEQLDNSGDTSEWKNGEALPASWKTAGAKASTYRQPLVRIVKGLIQAAQ